MSDGAPLSRADDIELEHAWTAALRGDREACELHRVPIAEAAAALGMPLDEAARPARESAP
jgi:hypothetical protein